ncbi:MAG: copper binding protein of plastocyanin/azurin family [Amycolatopsis sp.]|jgi:plastocyanin|uniref:cupredoxin domain-containing protein n=1 Tax=Amycolatopsis sp. TaxID=37632 RepID=UPI0026166D2F|nr:cupredoxin family copper-binding protein [Amycolatopsis sp.]MCU1682676.1 copper binding protein of plastocyanin/azurin family [Amycolatopsis sp.]
MDDLDTTTPAEGPPPAKAVGKRKNWPIGVAIIALAVAMFSLSILRGGDAPTTTAAGQTADVSLAALSAQSPMAMPLYQGLVAQQAGASAAKTVAVDASGYKFTPAALTIAVGDTVTWTNHDQAPHNVVITDGPEKFTTSTMQTGQSVSHTFTMAGSYSYYCAIHPDMKATITVTGSTTPPPTSSSSTPPPTSSSSTPPTSSSSMSMPPTSSVPGGTTCIDKAILQPFIDHLKAAHLETSPGQQVQDLLNLDQYIKTHTVLVENMLKPVSDGSVTSLLGDTLTPIIAHIKSAHLETSLGQQVQDLLNLDQYVKTHTVWLESVLTPLLNQATC